MAHGIETALYVGQPAWHRLGTTIEEACTLKRAIELSGLNWRVSRTPLYLPDGRELSSHVANVRETDGSILGVVGASYKILQNHEAFSRYQEIVDAGVAKIEACGSLFGGRKVWILLKLRDTGEVVEGDSLRNFLLLF